MFDPVGSKRRWPVLFLTATLLGVAGLAACGGGGGSVSATQVIAEALADSSSEQITIGISMYLLVDDLEDPDPTLSSGRTEAELTIILDGMNEICSQANIHFDLAKLDTMVVDADLLDQVAEGNVRAFFNRLGNSIPFTESDRESDQESGLISGSYAREIGGPDGITPLGSRHYMVMDQPSVVDPAGPAAIRSVTYWVSSTPSATAAGSSFRAPTE